MFNPLSTAFLTYNPPVTGSVCSSSDLLHIVIAMFLHWVPNFLLTQNTSN